MIHNTVNLEEWKARLSLTALEESYGSLLSLPAVTSPADLVAFHYLRQKELGQPHDLLHRWLGWLKPAFGEVKPLPADFFIFNRGEPSRRETTKVGGVPYWPAGRPWPRSKAGRAMTFVAQFCFADSSDIVGQKLPGDVLVIFANGEFGKDWFPGDDHALQFEWLVLGHQQLFAPERVPEPSWQITACYVSLYRGIDYPTFPTTLMGTKIGGYPGWKQGEPKVAGRFLCQLGSVFPTAGAYPFLNVPETRSWDAHLKNEGFLMWFDVGSLYFFLERTGRVNWHMQC